MALPRSPETSQRCSRGPFQHKRLAAKRALALARALNRADRWISSFSSSLPRAAERRFAPAWLGHMFRPQRYAAPARQAAPITTLSRERLELHDRRTPNAVARPSRHNTHSPSTPRRRSSPSLSLACPSRPPSWHRRPPAPRSRSRRPRPTLRPSRSSSTRSSVSTTPSASPTRTSGAAVASSAKIKLSSRSFKKQIFFPLRI